MFENTPSEIYRFRDLILEREGYEDYPEFLESSYWKGIKEKTKLSKYKGKYNQCKNCNTTENIQLHHEDYKWLLHKRELSNIIPLCKFCHEKLHFVAHHLDISFKEAKKIIMLGVLNMNRLEDVLLLKRNSYSINYDNINNSNELIQKLKNNKIVKTKSVSASITGVKQLISQNMLVKKWNEFSEEKKIEGRIGLYTTLTSCKPILENNNTVVFKTGNQIQIYELENIKNSLHIFLQNEFGDNISLEFKTDNKEKTINQLSYKEKFFQVAEEHPEIHDFKDKKIVEYEKTNNGDTEKAVLELIKDFKKTL
tara:strand:+ start:43 stop:972 length:930 start_codon:yes stop_codon:yes gene_type:complete